MKKISKRLFAISLAFFLAVTSCRDKEDLLDVITGSDVTNATSQAVDSDNVTSNVDDAIDKINSNFVSSASNARLDINSSSSCGFSVDSTNYNATLSGISKKTLVYNFDGSFCDGRIRTGKISAILITGNRFSDVNAQYQLVFEGYSVTKNAQTVTLSGTQLVTNETGGFPRFVITKSNTYANVIHHVTGSMNLYFSSGESRTWNIDRKITWTKISILDNDYLNVSVSSDRIYNGHSNISIYGINRSGYEFYTQILSPITLNGYCGWYKPSGGERKHTILDSDGSIKLTSDTQIEVGSDGCASGFTVLVTNKRNKSKTFKVTY